MSSARATRRLLRAELTRRPGRFLLTSLAVAIGVAGFVALRAGTRAALTSAGAAMEAVSGPAALQLLAAGTPGAPLPAETLARARATAGVHVALPTADVPSLPVEELEGWVLPLFPGEETGVRVLGALLDEEAKVGRIVLVDGSLPSAPSGKAPYSVLVGASWARAHDVKIGRSLSLTAPRGEVSVVVTGMVDATGLGARQGNDVVIGWLPDMQAGFSLGHVEEEIALVLAAGAREQEVARALERALGPGVVVAQPASRGAHMVQRLKNLEAGMTLTSSLSLFLCAFAVIAIFGTAAAERRRDVGLLRSLGLSPRAAAAPIALEAALAGAAGALLGALLGTPAARVVSAVIIRGAGGTPYPVPLSLTELVVGALLGIGVAIVSGGVPALLAAREPPLDAVRALVSASGPPPRVLPLVGAAVAFTGVVSLFVWPPGTVAPGASYAAVLAVLGGAVAVLPSAAWVLGRRPVHHARWLGLRGLAWRPQRAGLAAGAMLGAVGVVGGVAGLGRALHDELERWAERTLSADLFVRRPAGIGDEDLATFRATAGVATVSAVDMRPVFVDTPAGTTVALTAMGLDDTLVTRQLPPRDDGSPRHLERGEVLITSVLQAQLGLRVDGELSLRGPHGPVTLRVVGELVDFTSNGYAIFVRKETLAALFDEQQAPRAEIASVLVAPGAAVADVAALLRKFPGVRVETRDELRTRVLQRVEDSLGALDALGWLAGLIGFLAVSATLARATLERRAQFAALRAIGATPEQLVRLIVVEALALALLGALPGTLLAVLFAFVFTASAAALGLPLPTVIPWSAIAAAVLSSSVAAVIAALGPARRALSVAPAEALSEG